MKRMISLFLAVATVLALMCNVAYADVMDCTPPNGYNARLNRSVVVRVDWTKEQLERGTPCTATKERRTLKANAKKKVRKLSYTRCWTFNCVGGKSYFWVPTESLTMYKK